MVAIPIGVRVAATIVFLVSGALCLRHAVRRRVGPGGVDRIGYGAHALMSASMVDMAWLPPLWPTWQMAVFAVAAGCFATRVTGVGLRWRARITSAHYFLLATVMIGMLWAMAPWPGEMRAMAMPVDHPSSAGQLFAMAGGAYCLAAATLPLLDGRRMSRTGARLRPCADVPRWTVVEPEEPTCRGTC